ncbi:MAG: hypothetical protein KC431_05275, partial [Myxococcales bacterium]|nr:hypothetical protein [Myxococcales bacterium]
MTLHARAGRRSASSSPGGLTLLLTLLLTAVLPGTLGCRPQPGSALFDHDAALDHAARLEAWLERHPDDERARLELAHVYWLHLAEPSLAIGHLDLLTSTRAEGKARRNKRAKGPELPSPQARFARAALAHSHLDANRAWEESVALLHEAPLHGDRDHRAQAMALSAPAARILDNLLGLRPGDVTEFERVFADFDLEQLPAETVEELLSTRAQVARLRGEDYRPYYAQQGCVQDWAVGPVEGFRGALELDRLPLDRPFVADPEATATALSCAVRVWNPEPRAGIRRMRTVVEVPGETMRLSVGAQFPARVYVDDTLVWASDRSDRYAAQEPAFLVPTGPGRHRIEIQTAIPSERAWLLVRASEPGGRPLKTAADPESHGSFAWDGAVGAGERALLERADAHMEIQPWTEPKVLGLRGPVYEPLRLYLALDDALADGDGDRAETLAVPLQEQSLGFAEAHLLLAEFELADPTRGRTSSAARQQAELEAALALDPTMGRALVGLFDLRLARGEDVEVLEDLEALSDLDEVTAAAMNRDGLSFSLLRYEAYRRRGSDYQAEQALEAAAAIHPGNCDVLMARRAMARERSQVAIEDQLSEALGECPGS